MDVCLAIRQRLAELGLEQRDLASAAGVTDSYISQLLNRKKAPPAPDRTDIYAKMGAFLKLPKRKLSELAAHQRTEELRKKLSDSPVPLFQEVRELVLRKCRREKRGELRSIFERQPFGEFERLVTQKLLEVVKKAAQEELESEAWIKLVAQLNGDSYEETRVNILEFLDTDVLNISVENCISFLDPLIDSWDIDLASFGIEIVLNRRLARGYVKKLEFVEKEPDWPFEVERGLKEFLGTASLSGDATEEETDFLRGLRFKHSRPTALYYYRELQNLRDPLSFREAVGAAPHKYRDKNAVERQTKLDARQGAPKRWTKDEPTRNKKRKLTS